MSSKVKKWWNNNSKDFQKDHKVPIGITYGPGIPTENKLNLIGNVKGKNVLEIGCGGAQCGIEFAKNGAKVTGVDISKKQLEYAKKLAEKNNVKIKFIEGDMKNLNKIKSNSQDIVFSSWALFYVSDLKKCFKEVYRVLKKKGIFVFSTHHPFWETIDKKKLKIKRNYFDTGEYQEKLKRGIFVAYKHTISEIINNLINANLTIEYFGEPDPRKKDKDTSKEVVPEKYKIKAMKIIPRTMIIKSRKLK